MGWGFIFMCLGFYLGFHALDLLFAVVQLSNGFQNAIELIYTSVALLFLARSLALAVRIIFGRRNPLH